MDVFISYSSRDKEWVRGELLSRIEQAGLKAYIDFRDFTPGAPAIKNCQRGVVEARKTLLVLTPDYVASEWCEFESIMAQTLTPANRELRIIPLLKAECEKPLSIGTLTHIEFTDGADQDLAWRQLLTALGAPPAPESPKEPQRDQWFLAHPYPMPPNFTGRLAERAMLDSWLAADPTHPLLSLRALGGFGKSALVWHWLIHDVQPSSWPRVVWWSFYERDESPDQLISYEGDAKFDHFLTDTLHYLSGGRLAAAVVPGKDAVERLLEELHKPGTLLVLDGFERLLRAFGRLDAAYQGDGAKDEDSDRNCISQVTELFLYRLALLPHLRSKVLLTTRLCPRVLEAKGGGLLTGAREVVLEQMQPDDAVAFFVAQGIRGTHTEIKAACEPYGYHPLSLRLLAGLIVYDFQQPCEIAAAKRIDVSGDLVQRKQHVLERAYDSLTPSRQALLGRVACFRNSVSYGTLKALAETEPNAILQGREREKPQKGSYSLLSGATALDFDLRALVARGLLHHEPREGRFDLHPIVRRYAYDRLTGPDRAAAHLRLRDYFAAVPPTEKVRNLEDLIPIIELYHHTVRAGQLDEAYVLYRDRLHEQLYYQLGAYQLIIDLLRALFLNSEEHPPCLGTTDAQGWTLNALASVYGRSGQPRRAIPLFEQANAVGEDQNDKKNLAISLGNLARSQIDVGMLRAAETNLRRRIKMSREIDDERDEASGHLELNLELAYRGAFAESEMELMKAMRAFEKLGELQAIGIVNAYHTLQMLLRLRQAVGDGSPKPDTAICKKAVAFASHALELANEVARVIFPVERDYVRAHWLLGAAHRVSGRENEAERHLLEALERCRRIKLVDHEADILIDLARLRAVAGAEEKAQQLADEARSIAERSSYVLQGADAHVELARLAFSRGDRRAAREHAEEARRLATCDGPPDYTYAAAYAESGALLTSLESV